MSPVVITGLAQTWVLVKMDKQTYNLVVYVR